MLKIGYDAENFYLKSWLQRQYLTIDYFNYSEYDCRIKIFMKFNNKNSITDGIDSLIRQPFFDYLVIV